MPVVLGVSMASWNGGVGNRLVAPASLAATNDYRLAIGQLTVDLTSAPLDGRDVNVSAETKIGDLAVLVAPDATVVVDSHVGAGHSNVLGHDHSGLNVTDHVTERRDGQRHGSTSISTPRSASSPCAGCPTGAQVVTRRCESVLARRSGLEEIVMPTLRTEPTHLLAAGTPPKDITEHIGEPRPGPTR